MVRDTALGVITWRSVEGAEGALAANGAAGATGNGARKGDHTNRGHIPGSALGRCARATLGVTLGEVPQGAGGAMENSTGWRRT